MNAAGKVGRDELSVDGCPPHTPQHGGNSGAGPCPSRLVHLRPMAATNRSVVPAPVWRRGSLPWQ
jgi:hypothetical protein